MHHQLSMLFISGVAFVRYFSFRFRCSSLIRSLWLSQSLSLIFYLIYSIHQFQFLPCHQPRNRPRAVRTAKIEKSKKGEQKLYVLYNRLCLCLTLSRLANLIETQSLMLPLYSATLCPISSLSSPLSTSSSQPDPSASSVIPLRIACTLAIISPLFIVDGKSRA